MAIVNINFGCGCGYNAKTVEEATEHADKRCHTLTVTGTIKPSVSKAQKASLYSSDRPRLHVPEATSPVSIEERADFSSLRDKLLKK